MISNISFSGRVFLTGGVHKLCKKTELDEIQIFADKTEADVVILNRDYYSDNCGRYETVVVKEDETTGKNIISKRTFDFKKALKFNFL